MIEINSDNLLENFTNQKITKVKSIIITTDAGDIVLAPCRNATATLTTIETLGSIGYLLQKKATIEVEYDNIITIK